MDNDPTMPERPPAMEEMKQLHVFKINYTVGRARGFSFSLEMEGQRTSMVQSNFYCNLICQLFKYLFNQNLVLDLDAINPVPQH
jgi:hypothetical protein